MSRAHVSADYYYRIPVRPIYKSYPVYAPGREPAGYEEWLKRQEPETVFEVSKLKTEADWIKAGEVVFDAPIFYDALVRAADVKDPLWHVKTGALAAKDGSLPYFRYVVREKGKVELGTISCAMCHTRVMPDRTVIKGAQGNFPRVRGFAWKPKQNCGEENHSNNWQGYRNYGYVQYLVVRRGRLIRKPDRCHQYHQEIKNGDQTSSDENQSGQRQ